MFHEPLAALIISAHDSLVSPKWIKWLLSVGNRPKSHRWITIRYSRRSQLTENCRGTKHLVARPNMISNTCLRRFQAKREKRSWQAQATLWKSNRKQGPLTAQNIHESVAEKKKAISEINQINIVSFVSAIVRVFFRDHRIFFFSRRSREKRDISGGRGTTESKIADAKRTFLVGGSRNLDSLRTVQTGVIPRAQYFLKVGYSHSGGSGACPRWKSVKWKMGVRGLAPEKLDQTIFSFAASAM